MKIKRLFALLTAVLLLLSVSVLASCSEVRYAHPNKASVYETTGTKASLLGRKSSLEFKNYTEEDYSRQTIFVSTDKTYQEYMGNGASMTHSSAYLLMHGCDAETRRDVLNDLFGKDGANFTMIRIPIGASDYISGTSYFTCDDVPSGETDMNLERFNLDRDQDIIAVLKEVLTINPNVKFMASPWSAPAWMKGSSLVGGGSLLDGMYEVYADYLVKFVTEYAKHGITISSLTILNEPSVGALSYPTMDMNPVEAAEITRLTGEKLKAADLDVDIVAWDFNYGTGSAADIYFEEIYGEGSGASKYSAMAGLHGYSGDGYFDSASQNGLKVGIELLSRQYGKGSIITEITESSGSNDFAANLTYACKNIVINPCSVQYNYDDESWNGCSGSMYWNFVLTSDGQPTPAQHGNECYGVISLDEVNRQGVKIYKYKKSSAYYAMAHMSKFLYEVDGTPCKGLLATTDYSDLCVAAYYRADGAIVVVVCNTSETNSAPIDIVIGGKFISYDMVPQSMATFVC